MRGAASRLVTGLLSLALTAAVAGVAWSGPATAGAFEVDLEIVLAVDVSGSVDDAELRLQLGGIAAAFRDPAIQTAIASGPTGRIAVCLMLWADGAMPKDNYGWHLIDSRASAEKFATLVTGARRRTGGGTGIGDAVAFAMQLIDRNGIDALRRVVDVSGDGRETPAREEEAILLPQARVMAMARQATVNGLAILTDVPDLDQWYHTHVTTGPGNFVIAARDFDDFERAFREKLFREISANIASR